MKTLVRLMLALIGTVCLQAVEVGAPLADVIAEKGQPLNKLEMNGTTVLNYSDLVIKVREGKVISMKAPGGSEISKSSASGEPAPAVAPAPKGWLTNLPTAQAAAKKHNRKLVLFFTGSDWCGWCVKLDREILSTADFKAYADENLVLLKLDFPRKSPQSEQLKAQNAALASKYGIRGYPTLVILNASGKEIGRMGYQAGGPKPFVKELKSLK